MKRRKRVLVAGAGLVAFVLGLASSLRAAPMGDREGLERAVQTCGDTLGGSMRAARRTGWISSQQPEQGRGAMDHPGPGFSN